MHEIPVLETARFRLRGSRYDDFEAFAAMWADARVTRFIGGKPRGRGESWLKFLSMSGMWAAMGYGHWVFAERESDQFMGSGGLFWLDRGIDLLNGFPEAGWSIAPDWWGKGAASELMAAALGWADHALPDAEVRCIINPGHSASERVAAKLGFTVIGQAVLEPDPVNVYARPREGEG